VCFLLFFSIKNDILKIVVFNALILVLINMKNSNNTIYHSKSLKVYKNNKLNVANFGNFNNTDYQVFLYLITNIAGVDEIGKYLQPEKLDRVHVITAKEFSKEFNTNIDNSYRFLHKACKKLMKTSIILEKIELNETWEVNLCSTAKYNKKEGKITIEFTDSIMPYLSQVTEKFLLYNLKEISNFKSLYTTRLYELIQEFKTTGYMIKSVVELRKIFVTGTKFKQYNDFKKRTFESACREINTNYKINLGYEEIKDARKIVAIKFLFKKTRVHKVINPKTGIETNFYEKPKLKDKVSLNKKFNEKTILPEMESVFKKSEPKPIKDILSKLLKKIM
jgi:plasmid replication initiation protein